MLYPPKPPRPPHPPHGHRPPPPFGPRPETKPTPPPPGAFPAPLPMPLPPHRPPDGHRPHPPFGPPPRPETKPVPPPPGGPGSGALLREIERSFGSLEDFRRILHSMTDDPRRSGWVYLVCAPDGRLRLVRTPRHVKPRGEVLLRIPAGGGRIDWDTAGERYEHHMEQRPPFPL